MSEMSCPGCLTTAKGLAQSYSIAKSEAIKWMNDNKKSVAIYNENYNVLFMEAQCAVNLGLNIREILTYS
jgi:hypothetical protein